MKAVLRRAKISPKKANLVAAMVRGMTVLDALSALERLPKKGAILLRGLLLSAVSNAQHTAGQKPEDLLLRTLTVTKGPSLKRFIPMARGRARPIDKATSHIAVELGVVVPKGEEDKGIKGTKGIKGIKETKETKETKAVEEYVPEEVAKKPPAPTFDASADPHAKGAKRDYGERRDRKGPSFQPHRRGGRGL